MVFLNRDTSTAVSRQKRAADIVLAEELAALDEICARKELQIKEKQKKALISLFPTMCSLFSAHRLIEDLGRPFFAKVISQGILADPDTALAARVLTETFVVLCNSGWDVGLYHDYFFPVFRALTSGDEAGGAPRSDCTFGGSSTMAGPSSACRPGAGPPLETSTGMAPFRNLKSPRGSTTQLRSRSGVRNQGGVARSATPMGKLSVGQRKLRKTNASLVLICITREMLSQYEEELAERASAAKKAGETEFSL